MEIIINFLSDAGKIIFGSAVVGFFIPSLAGRVSFATFVIGSLATIIFLWLAVVLLNLKKKKI
ncbi:MAG: hypothetical protein AAB677_02045 [Patescibacteria group bacterium]